MIILEPSVKLLEEVDSASHIARCARVYYNNETGNDEKTIANLIANKHFSVFRHSTCYYIVPIRKNNITRIIRRIHDIIFLDEIKTAGIDIKINNNYYYIACNGNFLIDHPYYSNIFIKYKVNKKAFDNTEVGHSMMRYTFEVITQISTNRELNRVSPNNITEQPTQYIYENGCIIRPHWVSKEIAFEYKHTNPERINTLEFKYLNSCYINFIKYKMLIDEGLNKQDACGILPLDTATKVIYTYSVDEWKHICDSICNKHSNQNTQIIANMIKTELNDLGYDI